jgi:transposase
MLLRRGIYWTPGRNAWTQAHRGWLNGLRFDRAADAVVFNDYLLAIEQLESRLQSLDEKLQELSQEAPYREPVAHLRCFRGIDTVTAMTVVSELYDIARFGSPRELMGFLGLVPSEQSSGSTERRGSITKAGNSHVRRVLVEAAWHYRHRPGVGQALAKRRRGQPAEVIAIADRAQHRLFRRYWTLMGRGKPSPKAVVAVARELVGFVWAALVSSQVAHARLNTH